MAPANPCRDCTRRLPPPPARPRPAVPPSPTGDGPRQEELSPERTPIRFREVTQKRGLALSAGWMTSKRGGWGWRLVTGATQGGPTCPTRSGLVLHPALCPEHRHRPDSSPTHHGVLWASGERPETQAPGFTTEGLAAHPILFPPWCQSASTHPFTHMHTHRAPWPGRGRAGLQDLSRLHLTLSTSFSC